MLSYYYILAAWNSLELSITGRGIKNSCYVLLLESAQKYARERGQEHSLCLVVGR